MKKGHAPDAFSNKCRGKKAYTSKRLAAGVRRVMLLKIGASSRDTLDVYKCSACGGWHIGNSQNPTNPAPQD